jgi:hypothetical protein
MQGKWINCIRNMQSENVPRREKSIPAGKCNITSSNFPSTITIPNFKPMGVVEFWKRYNQNDRKRMICGDLKFVPQ